MTMKCFNCKSDIESGKKFCSECGASIELDFSESSEGTNAKQINSGNSKKGNQFLAKLLIVFAIFGGVFYGVYSLISAGVSSVTESFSPDATPSIPEISGKVGQPVQDGQMTFQLNSSPKCFNVGSTKLCRFDISVLNHSKTSATFFDSVQKLVDADGNFYDATSPYMRSDYSADFALKELNPGMAVRGYVFFELPNSVTPTKLILHDSMFSDGVAVGL